MIELNKFLVNFADAVEDESITNIDENTIIVDLDSWDSFSTMSIIAMIDEQYNVFVSGDEITESTTFRELFEFIKMQIK